MEINDAVKQMLDIVDQLQKKYPKKRFTLDGRLVGDLGEILVEQVYDITLYEGLQKHHDAETSDGKKVQIKATMKDSLTFPADHVPDYYIGIKIHSDGTFIEIFNGLGSDILTLLRNRAAKPRNNLHVVSIKKLEELNKKVITSNKIPRRSII